PFQSTSRPFMNGLIICSAASKSATFTGFWPMYRRAESPRPMPMIMRPLEMSWRVAYALASTVGSRVPGFVTIWPRLIFDEPPAAPLLFGKFENALIGPGDPIVLPPEATHVDAEAELCVEIGRGGRRIPEGSALDHVRGYRCANDVSARNIQYSESQWLRAK